MSTSADRRKRRRTSGFSPPVGFPSSMRSDPAEHFDVSGAGRIDLRSRSRAVSVTLPIRPMSPPVPPGPHRPLLERAMPAGASRRCWIVVALGAGASLGLYALLLAQVPDLAWAKPTYAGEVFPWVQ